MPYDSCPNLTKKGVEKGRASRGWRTMAAIIKAEPRPATYNEASFPSSPRPIQAAAL